MKLLSSGWLLNWVAMSKKKSVDHGIHLCMKVLSKKYMVKTKNTFILQKSKAIKKL